MRIRAHQNERLIFFEVSSKIAGWSQRALASRAAARETGKIRYGTYGSPPDPDTSAGIWPSRTPRDGGKTPSHQLMIVYIDQYVRIDNVAAV